MSSVPYTAPCLSPRDVAEHLGLSVEAIQRAVRAGRLPHVRVGGPRGRIRCSWADVDRFIGREPPPDAPAEPAYRITSGGTPPPARDPRTGGFETSGSTTPQVGGSAAPHRPAERPVARITSTGRPIPSSAEYAALLAAQREADGR
jgi:excisionase family DNA binding protein